MKLETKAEVELYEKALKARPYDFIPYPESVSAERGSEIFAAARKAKEAVAAADPTETFGPLEIEDAGLKYDSEKTPYHLLPTDALEAIAEILDFGAKKYAPRNWEKGLDWHRVYRAALGHLFAWWARKGPDEETGKSHLWHAGCCIMFLISYELRGVGKDDRPSNSA